MIGNVIQGLYLTQRDYPAAAALSFVLMAVIMVAVFVYIRFAGSEALMGEESGALMEAGTAGARLRARESAPDAWAWLREHALNIYAGFAIAYLLLPVAIIILFSFNNPAGKYNFTWVGFTLSHWGNAFGLPDLNDALFTSLELAAFATLISTASGR